MSLRTFLRDEVAKKEDSDRRKGHRRSWNEWIYPRLGAPVAYLLLKTPISAPQVLLIMLVTGLAGPFFISQAKTVPMLVGVACLVTSTWMDAADGIVYRHRGQPAVRGAFLDRFNHALIYPLTYAAFGLAAYRLTDDWRYVVVGMAAGMFRDAYETLCLYEARLIQANRDSVQRVRTGSFFRLGMHKTGEYWWVSPFYVLRNGANLLVVHPLAYATMVTAIALGLVPSMVWYFLVIYVVRFFSYAGLSFGVTFRGK